MLLSGNTAVSDESGRARWPELQVIAASHPSFYLMFYCEGIAVSWSAAQIQGGGGGEIGPPSPAQRRRRPAAHAPPLLLLHDANGTAVKDTRRALRPVAS